MIAHNFLKVQSESGMSPQWMLIKGRVLEGIYLVCTSGYEFVFESGRRESLRSRTVCYGAVCVNYIVTKR